MVVAEPSGPGGGARSVGRLSKLGVAAQVLAVLALSVVVAVLLVLISQKRALRYRDDWTATGRNTLDPQTVELLAALPEPVGVDVFFRPGPDRYAQVYAEAQVMMADLLREAAQQFPDKVELVEHDLGDLGATEAAMRELGVSKPQAVVVHLGDRKVILGLTEDVAEIDFGNLDPRAYVPATLRRFRGEAAFAEAVATVATPGRPLVLFSTGHGEPEIEELDEPRGLGRLAAELRAQGYEVRGWNGGRDGALAQETAALAIVAPLQPLAEDEVELVRAFVDRGGRLLALAAFESAGGPGTVEDLLRPYGIGVQRGIVCEPIRDPNIGYYEGQPQCAAFRIQGERLTVHHPVTAPLVRGNRYVAFKAGRALERGANVLGRRLMDLATSSPISWKDLPGDDGRYNWALDQAREQGGPFSLVLSSVIEPNAPAGGGADEEVDGAGDGAPAAERREARVIGLAAQDTLSNELWEANRDFALNSIHWLASRDLRIRITPSEPQDVRIDVRSGDVFPRLTLVAWWLLPGVCVLFGFGTWFLRRRG